MDFGSGRGRVVFYANYLFDCQTKGIEANPITYDEAINNLHDYLKIKKNALESVNFELIKAEDYLIKNTDNVFYFFNSFSVVVFKKVISKIVNSVKEFPRKITLIMYYSFQDYLDFLNVHTNFKVVKEITDDTSSNLQQNFIIYEY